MMGRPRKWLRHEIVEFNSIDLNEQEEWTQQQHSRRGHNKMMRAWFIHSTSEVTCMQCIHTHAHTHIKYIFMDQELFAFQLPFTSFLVNNDGR